MDDHLDMADAAAPDTAIAAPAPAPQAYRFSFTGSGSEYFRIWAVNLLFSVATLGIYSAWAKVRRLQYFNRNTRLAGACFDFRGSPRTILRGRVFGVMLLAGYEYAFGFSLVAGTAVFACLLLCLPFLMRGALRFRLCNTYYRGFAFGFSGSVGDAYRTYLPPLATILVPGALMFLFPTSPFVALLFPCYLGWPLMHGAMKRYQHGHLRYGATPSAYALPARRFFRPYLGAVLIMVASFVAATAVTLCAYRLGLPERPEVAGFEPPTLLMMAQMVCAFYLLAVPYLQVRVANLAWSDTAFPGMRVGSAMRARALMRLQAANAVLTLLTLGLYRPFAVVRVYRYRLAHLVLDVDGDIELRAAGPAPLQPGGAADGVAEFVGLDLSW